MGAELTPIERARELILERVVPLPSEPVPLGRALGRFLAEPVSAADDVPAFDNSAMDGFAVRSTDLAEHFQAGPGGPLRLRLVDESRAGHPADGELRAGCAIAISTGAALPRGADAVIPIEDIAEAGGEIEVAGPVSAGRHVRRAGEDVRAGERVLEPGVRLGAAELGTLAAVGRPEAACARQPRVKVLLTGDELVEPGEPLGPGQIRDSNAYAVPPLAVRAGAAVGATELVGDDRELTRDALERALGGDVAVVCGGVSVGPHDHVRPALAELGVEQVFWRIALRPGKPAFFGLAPSGALVFGLPGNPVSAMVTFTLLVTPALLALQGGDPGAVRVAARMGTGYEKAPGRAEAVRVGLRAGPEGWLATPTGAQGSHVLTSMLDADGLALLPAEAERIEPGETVVVELLR